MIQKLGLPETPDELAKKMTASSKLDSVLLDVAVTDPSPQRATDIVNAVGEVFPDLVAELERPTTPDVRPAVAVRVVQPALVPIKPSSASLLQGLTDFAIVQSYLDTASKWGLDKLDTLRQLFTTGAWLPPTLKPAE